MSQDNLKAQLYILRQTLKETHQQLSSNPSLTPEMITEMLAPLRRQVAALETQIQATRFDLHGQRFEQQVNVAGNHVDQRPVTLQPDASPPVLDEETALDRYLRHVVEANRRLRLQGIRSAGRLVSIGLEEVYVTLSATERRTVAVEEAWVEEMAHLAPGKTQRLARLGTGRPRETVAQVKVKVQEARRMCGAARRRGRGGRLCHAALGGAHH